MSDTITSSISIINNLFSKMGPKRSLRDYKLPFTGHHLVYPDPVEEAICYTLAPFLLCCIIHHIIKSVAGYVRRRKLRKREYDILNTNQDGSSLLKVERRWRWTRWYRAPAAGFRNTMELRTLSASWVSVSNYAELCWTLLYCAIVLVPTFYLSYGGNCKCLLRLGEAELMRRWKARREE
jgi:hypothetical protein